MKGELEKRIRTHLESIYTEGNAAFMFEEYFKPIINAAKQDYPKHKPTRQQKTNRLIEILANADKMPKGVIAELKFWADLIAEAIGIVDVEFDKEKREWFMQWLGDEK